MNKNKRKFNRNLFFSKLHLHGLTLESLGKKLSPPVCKGRISQIVKAGAPESRLKEITSVLKTNVQTLFPKAKEEADGNATHPGSVEQAP
jgi:hypothetical protein